MFNFISRPLPRFAKTQDLKSDQEAFPSFAINQLHNTYGQFEAYLFFNRPTGNGSFRMRIVSFEGQDSESVNLPVFGHLDGSEDLTVDDVGKIRKKNKALLKHIRGALSLYCYQLQVEIGSKIGLIPALLYIKLQDNQFPEKDLQNFHHFIRTLYANFNNHADNLLIKDGATPASAELIVAFDAFVMQGKTIQHMIFSAQIYQLVFPSLKITKSPGNQLILSSSWTQCLAIQNLLQMMLLIVTSQYFSLYRFMNKKLTAVIILFVENLLVSESLNHFYSQMYRTHISLILIPIKILLDSRNPSWSKNF